MKISNAEPRKAPTNVGELTPILRLNPESATVALFQDRLEGEWEVRDELL
jgi:hypothetical protein